MIAVNNDTWMLILLLAVVFGALVAITTFSGRGSLDSIKSKLLFKLVPMSRTIF